MCSKNSRITIVSLFWPTAMIRPKSQNFKIGHDGILSIGNFILMIKIIFYFFSCPVTGQQPKNVLPISVATRNFLFISFFSSRNQYFPHISFVASKKVTIAILFNFLTNFIVEQNLWHFFLAICCFIRELRSHDFKILRYIPNKFRSIWVQKYNCIPRILKFDILKVPLI
jgi:hypothetical protein